MGVLGLGVWVAPGVGSGRLALGASVCSISLRLSVSSSTVKFGKSTNKESPSQRMVGDNKTDTISIDLGRYRGAKFRAEVASLMPMESGI
jgi:hypothetical protein